MYFFSILSFVLLLTSCTTNKPLEDYKCDYFIQITKELLDDPSDFERVFLKYKINKRIPPSDITSDEFIRKLQELNDRGLSPKDCRMDLKKRMYTNKKFLRVSVSLVFYCDQCPNGYEWPESATFVYEIDEGQENIAVSGFNRSHT